MSVLYNTIHQIIPAPIRQAYCSVRGFYNFHKPELHWRLDSLQWASFLRMRAMKNRHRGQRCFIIGNGPSLNKMDLSPLQNEITFGLNRIYLFFPKMGFSTTYYVAVNKLVIEQCATEIERLTMPKFISWHARGSIQFTSNTIFICDPYNSRLGFSKKPAMRIWEGSTVTYVAMQIAFYMGFSQVILIGVDHDFATKGEAHKAIVSDGPDPNHFSPDYFGKGFCWQLPDLEASEQAYRLAKQIFELEGREILDATVEGKLNVFPKVDYKTLLKIKN